MAEHCKAMRGGIAAGEMRGERLRLRVSHETCRTSRGV